MVLLLVIFLLAVTVVIYHHVIYPQILQRLANKVEHNTHHVAAPVARNDMPTIGVFITAYNEAAFIEEKLHNLACQLYPNDKMGFHLVTDGCDDNTAIIAKGVMDKLSEQLIYCTLDELATNGGKINALNLLIDKYRSAYDIIVFTDVSALVSINAFEAVAKEMSDQQVVALSGKYLPKAHNHKNLEKYWHYQNAIRELEGNLGAVNGFAGAMFAMRSKHVVKLDKGVINDDFVQVVQAVAKDKLARFSNDIAIVECESDGLNTDLTRRMRIGAGNWQQIKYILNSIQTFNGAQLFSFVSNKLLRGLMPVVIVTAYISLLMLAFKGALLAQLLIASAALVHLIGFVKSFFKCDLKLPVIDSVNYLVMSYFTCAVGIVMGTRYKKAWRRVKHVNFNVISINICKRAIDIIGALIGLILSIPIVLIAAILIKLESKGPVFFHQLRVGKITHTQADLIYVHKLRTMHHQAEKHSGAVWAQGNDTRITKVGRILRKTRIDELPQLWNVLKGDMSLVGPRPERPVFYQQLEREIPYFIQRTFCTRPGITGLAQVMNGYDNSVEDVRNKIAWDYSYVLSMSKLSTWLMMECAVILKTVKVVVLGKGQ